MRYVAMRLRLATAFAASLSLGGCAAWISSDQATNASGGVRYYLPQPAIEVLPQPDGSVKVRPVYLPDTSQAYYVRAGSLLSKYTLDVQLDENGLLESVQFDPEAAAVPAKAAEVSGELAKARFEALQAARTKEAEADAQAAKELRDAQQAVDALKYQLGELRNLLGRTQGDTARAAIETKIDTLELQLAEVRGKLRALRGGARADRSGDEGLNAVGPGGMPQAHGPVYYMVEQRLEPHEFDVDGTKRRVEVPVVMLRALAQQRAFDTSAIARPPRDSAAPMELTITPDPLRPNAAGQIKGTLSAKDDLAVVKSIQLYRVAEPTKPLTGSVLNHKSLGKTISFELAPATPAGEYFLDVEFADGGSIGPTFKLVR
jgi:hypothetical protein